MTHRIAGHAGTVRVMASLVLLLVLAPGQSADAASKPKIWEAIRSGESIVIMRHAIAPGTGDPASFALDDCDSQRNLSDLGRRQAEAIGDRFRDNGIDNALVFSSQWCRCLDTAEGLKLGEVIELPLLNSFFTRRENRDSQTRDLLAWLDDRALDAVHVLVTHQVNITALTGVYPSSGELVVVRLSQSGKPEVVGTIETAL